MLTGATAENAANLALKRTTSPVRINTGVGKIFLEVSSTDRNGLRLQAGIPMLKGSCTGGVQ
jgi:hypothetical protein